MVRVIYYTVVSWDREGKAASVNLSEKLILSWEWNWFICWRCQQGGCRENDSVLWTMPLSRCIPPCRHIRGPDSHFRGRDHQGAPQNTSGGLVTFFNMCNATFHYYYYHIQYTIGYQMQLLLRFYFTTFNINASLIFSFILLFSIWVYFKSTLLRNLLLLLFLLYCTILLILVFAFTPWTLYFVHFTDI